MSNFINLVCFVFLVLVFYAPNNALVVQSLGATLREYTNVLRAERSKANESARKEGNNVGNNFVSQMQGIGAPFLGPFRGPISAVSKPNVTSRYHFPAFFKIYKIICTAF